MINLGKAALYFAAIISFVLLLSMPGIAGDRKKVAALRTCYWWVIGAFGALTAATLVLLAAFIAKDFSLEYVASYSSSDLELVYRMAALWAGHQGSLLLWAWILAGFSALIAGRKLGNPDRLDTYALIILDGVQAFFLALLVLAGDPFAPAPPGMVAGQGLNPLLRHWAMILHPPTLFIGYAGLTVPFAYAIAAAWTRDASAKWVKLCHSYSVFSWLFLSIGIFLGSLWAYVVLGWGGYWGWDPVENASLLPWLTATALLHSFTVYKRRDAFKIWSLSLAVISFLLVITATFITRGGILQSVHAFEPNNILVWLFVGFILFVAGASGRLIAARYQQFRGGEQLLSVASKEFTYFLNNLVLLLSAIILLLATLLPVFGGPALNASAYNAIAQPIGLVYVLVLAICPVFAWRHTDPERLRGHLLWPGIITAVAAAPLYLYWQSLVAMMRGIDPAAPSQPLGYMGLLIAVFTFVGAAELFVYGAAQKAKRTNRSWPAALAALFVENRAQAGGYMSHLGMAVIVAGLVGSSMFVGDINQTMPNKPGASIDVSNYALRLVGVKQSVEKTATTKDKIQTATFNLVDKGTGRTVSVLRPKSKECLEDQGQPKQEAREAAISYQPFRDIFVIFNGANTDGTISVNVKVNPLIMFVWGGSIVLVAGMLIAWWPPRKSAKAAVSRQGQHTARRTK